MDVLSIAGFALNVVSYLKENPLEFGGPIEEPTAVTAPPQKSKALADIKMPTTPSVAIPQKSRPPYPKHPSSYTKRTSVGSSGQISMARVDSATVTAEPLTQAVETKRSVTKLNSGLDQSGRYFFRKRDL